MKRQELIETLAINIEAIEYNRPLLVAVDGLDASGKTALARELSSQLRIDGRTVIEASIDGFHNPRETRYRLGRDSPEGYYRDSFNIEALKKYLLVPLKVGCMHYRTRVFDYRTDKPVDTLKSLAATDHILVFDGVFTHRPELRNYWNYSIYLHISDDESIRRGIERDPSDPAETRRRYMVRYLPGQMLYHREAEPLKYASIIVDNTEPMSPVILGESKIE